MSTSGTLFAYLVFTSSLKDGKNKIPRNFKQLLFTHESILQWIPSITDTIGTQHFVRYSEVSQTQGLPVYFW